jgi:hypothetical protein
VTASPARAAWAPSAAAAAAVHAAAPLAAGVTAAVAAMHGAQSTCWDAGACVRGGEGSWCCGCGVGWGAAQQETNLGHTLAWRRAVMPRNFLNTSDHASHTSDHAVVALKSHWQALIFRPDSARPEHQPSAAFAAAQPPAAAMSSGPEAGTSGRQAEGNGHQQAGTDSAMTEAGAAAAAGADAAAKASPSDMRVLALFCTSSSNSTTTAAAEGADQGFDPPKSSNITLLAARPGVQVSGGERGGRCGSAVAAQPL